MHQDEIPNNDKVHAATHETSVKLLRCLMDDCKLKAMKKVVILSSYVQMEEQLRKLTRERLTTASCTADDSFLRGWQRLPARLTTASCAAGDNELRNSRK